MDLPCDLSRSCEGFGKSMGGALHWIDAVPVAKPSVSVVMGIGRYSYSVIQVTISTPVGHVFGPFHPMMGVPCNVTQIGAIYSAHS